MVDVSGIPNMGFGGGGYFGGIPNQQPAMSAAQINAGMWGNYSPQQAQMTANNIYGAGGFGAQPAYYAGLGAAYGRQTGYYGDTLGLPPGQVTPAAQAAWGNSIPGGYPRGAVQRGPDLPQPDLGGYDPTNPATWAPQAWSTGLPGNMSPPNYFDTLTMGAGYNPYTGPSAGYNPYDPGSFGLGTRWGTPAQPSSMGLLGYDPNTSWQWAPNATDSRSLMMNYAPEPIRGDTGQLFDSIKYLQNNPDVAKAGMGGYEHYDKFGRGEGREAAWGNVFDPNTYLRTNQDVQQAGMDPRTHWLMYGQKEGRQGGGVLNETRDAIAQLLGQNSHPSNNPSYFNPSAYQPQGAGAGGWQDLYGLGGRFAAMGGGAGGGSLTPQQLINQGNAVNMPSGQFGGHPPQTFGAPAAGSLGAGGIYQDPFGGYVPGGAPGPGGLPGNYAPRYDALPLNWNNPFNN